MISAVVATPAVVPMPKTDSALTISPELCQDYLDWQRSHDLSTDTVATYRRKLELLYKNLPEDKRIRPGTLEELSQGLLRQGYAIQTVNLFLTVADGLMDYCGMRELQYGQRLKADEIVQPELTRGEYQRLLTTARALGKERTYLLIKTITNMGLSVKELCQLTVEAVEKGSVKAGQKIPECLRAELLDYVYREGILSGPVFLTNGGQPMSRTYITNCIQRLSKEAQVDGEKCNPRCLKKLYQTTCDGIQANLALLMERAYERMLEQEQARVGWGP